ncbi:MAG: hypothetical protein Q7R81_02070 [Candidatus Peregrinibacteria bacterium]|nr:hypothetical protein [Candidatus Peregrinibacteria bacterium]
MAKHPTTIRLDSALYKEVLREARKTGLSFSGVVQLLLHAFAEGTIHIGVSQHTEAYVRTLEKESAALSRLYKAGKVKGYTNSKELFRDILGE